MLKTASTNSTNAIWPSYYRVCLAGQGSGALRGTFMRLGADRTQTYELYDSDSKEWRYDAILVCYEISSLSSFKQARRILNTLPQDLPKMLIGTKLSTKRENPEVTRKARRLVHQLGQDLMAHIPCCSPLCHVTVSNLYLETSAMLLNRQCSIMSSTINRNSYYTINNAIMGSVSNSSFYYKDNNSNSYSNKTRRSSDTSATVSENDSSNDDTLFDSSDSLSTNIVVRTIGRRSSAGRLVDLTSRSFATLRDMIVGSPSSNTIDIIQQSTAC